ncbi:MAG TPA: sodium-dependent transporter [Jiangellaceae bacterium]|nr:sodium-dependent transporter [Jiangellaceae bacterium]
MAATGEVFKSRFTFVAAAVGMAVGTGNLWRFPRVVGEWGGGAFLIALVVANLVWAIPVLMSESLLGSKSRLGTVGAFRDFMGRKFAWLGGYMGFISIGILFYYSVVCGWALRYLVYSLSGTFTDGTDTEALWDGFVSSPVQTISFHALAILTVGFVVYRGLSRGFESLLKIIIPALFVILVILAIRAVTLPGAIEGLRYMFVPEWGRLGEADVWLQAFTQMAFSTGAGWGLYLTYSVYMRKREDMALNAGVLCAANLFASLLAGIAVLCTVFALRNVDYATEAAEAGNQGLAFIYFAELLGQMPGGVFFGPLFFLALFLAGVSSLIAMVELASRNVMDMGVRRERAVPGVVVVAFIAGVPSAYSVSFLTNQDNVWGVGLLLAGLCAAIAMLKYGVPRAAREIDEVSDFRMGRVWSICIYAFPVMFVVLFGWWIVQSVADVPEWWNPFAEFSLGTMLLQWGLLLVVMLALNRFLARKVGTGPMSEVSSGGGAQ